MRRRDFFVMFGVAALPFSALSARSQTRLSRHVGVLVFGNPDPEPFLKALREGLSERGYLEGNDIVLDVRSAQGRAGALPDLAAELVRLKVSVIVAYQATAAEAAKKATTEIPIVMAGVGDPLGTHLVASLSRPGGNVTGLSSEAADVAGKNLELLHEVLPSARQVAVLANPGSPFTQQFLAQIQVSAKRVGIDIRPIMVRPSEAFDAAFDDMQRQKMDAVFILSSVLRKDATDLALKYRLPAFSTSRFAPGMGALLSYSANYEQLLRETATYVDKVLRGAKPADLPVEQPTKFELVINLKTAKALGIDIPISVLTRADEVVE